MKNFILFIQPFSNQSIEKEIRSFYVETKCLKIFLFTNILERIL